MRQSRTYRRRRKVLPRVVVSCAANHRIRVLCASLPAYAKNSPPPRHTSLSSKPSCACDPDRRPAGRRTSRVLLSEPPPETLDRLREANSNAAIKLAPAADAPGEWNEAAELEWLGSRGECRQQVVWFGRLARHPGRRTA